MCRTNKNPGLIARGMLVLQSVAVFFLCRCQQRIKESGSLLLADILRMAVGSFQKGGICVSQQVGCYLLAGAMFQQIGGEEMPLRYNYDKPEKPRRIKGFEVFSLVFSSFSKPKNHTEISRIAGGVSLTTNE